MSIFGNRIMKVHALRREVEALKTEADAVRKTLALVIDDADSVTSASTKYKGNAYNSYTSVIAELAQKYEGTADWGILQTGAIIDVRSAFIIGEGLKVVPKDKKADAAEKEMEFVEAFMDYNDLTREMVQEFAKEAEIEGCFLAELFWDKDAEMVSIRFRSRSQYNYTVQTKARDYAYYAGVTWEEDGSKKSLEEGEFVYARFGGRVHQPNLPYPKVGKCLTQIESLDKALRDWREINRLFAAPKPHIECATKDDALAMQTAVNVAYKNWKIKAVLCHTGTFSYLSPDIAGVDAIDKEIVANAKMISGTTGVPVHFLGLPDLMSNRSTAENLMELVSASTRKEREIWKGTYAQIIEKAMDIWNGQSGRTQLDADALQVDIPYITEATWKRITDVYLPLALADKISDEALLMQVPGIDVEAEAELAEERRQESLERFSEMQKRMEQEGGDDDDEGGQDDSAGNRFEKRLGGRVGKRG